jgi:PAS domain S-box-containing protein
VRDENDQIVSVMEVSTDITDIKLLQDQAQQSRQRYRLLFDLVPCYISIQDRELNIVEANNRFTEAFGHSLGCKCFETYKHRKEECIVCPVQQTFEDGQVHSSEELVTARTGEMINTLVYTAPIHDGQGNIVNVMEMSTNITPIRELQSQLESMGLLISSVSHGIKGLLNGLDGGMYLVNTGMKKDDPERLKKGWEMVERNVDRIRSQVLNILYHAKERVPDYESLEVAGVCRDVAAIVEAKAVQLNVALELSIDDDVGEMEADPHAMRSLLVNLMENSLDACRVDTKEVDHRVELKVTGDDNTVVIEISDNGIGMDRETRDKAFSLFFSSKGAKGTGLGLFVANKIAKAHNGRIALETELGKRTCFILSIPRRRKSARKVLY